MLQNKKEHPKIKSQLHPRNKHKERYNFKELCKSSQDLVPFIIQNKYGDASINFFDPNAVIALNRALLKHFYNINYWKIPAGYLCPPIPGRADYIHYIADLMSTRGEIPTGSSVKCLDIGVGSNCIYPIIGCKEYGWSFVGSDIDMPATKSAINIVEKNPELKDHIQIRYQNNPDSIFKGIIEKGEHFHITICNPPFHSSASEAQAGTLRKLQNLKGKKDIRPKLNFGGQNNELWCDGGERRFVTKMIEESRLFADTILWFSTLISKEANLQRVYRVLRKVKAREVKTINMGQGNKKSRIVAWSFQLPSPE
ncbi:23S rRNA (adenine(1618)-N(6))-methyltransferase RlmF [Prolixibacteraceae bacterium Z1-6]|uniref:Ribosomal RNA large subunit methyltransferase F n=1 Tax=Draconibacterium aestuarii TaxID=2998507 RepID=A0A9X3F1N5_9BACT|nr:23S rRNA (adenine(1618)-N(6))-methyltransferase RlmF [Prolixibacteraceae bacterium Z1-6]